MTRIHNAISVNSYKYPTCRHNASIFTHPTRTGLRGPAYKFHQQRCSTRRCQYALSSRVIPYWNKPPAEILQDTSGRQLAAPFPRSTHIAYLLPQPIPPARMTPLRNSHLHDPIHILRVLVVYRSPYCSLDRQN